jgi:chaperonin GroEL
MANKVVTGNEAREGIMRGVMTVASAVRSTLGPKGRNVILCRPFGAPYATRDGVSVAKEIEPEDQLEAAGARLVRQVAAATDADAGDGTTTAVVLTAEMLGEGMLLVSNGADRLELAKGLTQATAWALERITQETLAPTRELIEHTAAVSLHGDREIAAHIADAVERVGAEGMIHIADAMGRETRPEVREGFQWDMGWTHPAFANRGADCVLEHPYILLSEREILQADPRTPNSPMNLLPLMELVAPTGRPLLVVAEKTGGDALTMLIHNVQRGTLMSCTVTAPGVGSRRKECLRDLAEATGATVYSPDAGNALSRFTLGDLGSCAVAIMHPDRTELIEMGAEHACKSKLEIIASIEQRAAELKALRAATDDDYEKELLTQRIGRLTDGVMILHVGASTLGELNEKKARVQDAVYSARAAKAEGVVPGGGIVLLRAARTIGERLAAPLAMGLEMSDAARMGAKVVMRALEAPLRQIALNAGISSDVALAEVKNNLGLPAYGLNAATGFYGDLVEQGIVDPVKVVRVAVEKAASIAALLLTSEAAVVPLLPPAGGPQAGMAQGSGPR